MKFSGGLPGTGKNAANLFRITRRQNRKSSDNFHYFLVAEEIHLIHGKEHLGQVGGRTYQASGGVVDIASGSEPAGMQQCELGSP